MITFFSQKFQNLVVPIGDKMVTFRDHFLSLQRDKKEEINFLRNRIEECKEKNLECSFREIRSKDINNPSEKLNILVQRMGGLGDILFCTPIIRYLKSLGHNINFFMHLGYWEALVLNEDVNKIYCSEEMLRLNEKLTPIYGVLPELITPEIFASHDKTIVFQGAIEHNKNAEVDHVIDAYYKWVDLDPEGKPKDLVLNLKEEEIENARADLIKRGYDPHKPFVSISPNASMAKNRSWPMQYTRKLMNLLQKDFNMVYIHRDEGWTMRQMFAVVANMDLVVTVDTGVLHVAGALQRPILTLFGSFNPDLRVRYYKNCEVICKNPEICGKFCFSHGDYCEHVFNKLTSSQKTVKANWQGVYPPCLTSIKPEEVAKKIYEKIEAERCVAA